MGWIGRKIEETYDDVVVFFLLFWGVGFALI